MFLGSITVMNTAIFDNDEKKFLSAYSTIQGSITTDLLALLDSTLA